MKGKKGTGGMKGKKGTGGKMKMTKGSKAEKPKGMKKEKKMKEKKAKGGKKGAQPVIFDTDYGPFIDDVFALGLIVNSGDLLDLKAVVTTSVNTNLSSKCVAKHLDLAGRSDIPVLSGASLPPESERGGVCALTEFVGFALEEECKDVTLPFEENGVEALAKMLEESGRDDWWYIVVGGQTSLKELVEYYPSAAARIDTVIMMGSNFCDGIEPYPGVFAPVVETNIACDPAAANFNLATSAPFKNIYITPVAVADEINGDDYKIFVEAAVSGADPGAAATLDFYKAWSVAARNSDILVTGEANAYDPDTASTPQFDACAVMLALELLGDCEPRMVLFDFPGVHYDANSFSLVPEGIDFDMLPEEYCPKLVSNVFDIEETEKIERPVLVALGYASAKAKDEFYSEMAARMAGIIPTKCMM
jgi:inosine-uridine nucleoside N-ribohydrolase